MTLAAEPHFTKVSEADGPSTFRLPTAPQMTYFLGESVIGSCSQPPPVAHHRPKEHRGVPLAETPEHPKPRVPSHPELERDKEPAGRPSSSKGPLDALRHHEGDLSRPISPFPRSSDTPNLSQPLAPVLLGASGPASALSSVSSRRNSLCLSEDLGSCPPSMKDGDVAVEDDEEQAEEDPGASCSSMIDSGSAPQLVMPSIKMPSRRPFTDEGKRMGLLKVLIAGDSGVGKTSLIKAIVQSCEHIVHVDPITPSAVLSSSITRSVPTTIIGSSGSKQRGARRQSSRESAGTSQITEIYASTKPYPEWWSEVDDFRILRRRKSLGDAVLDRNICFVDTPGYGSGSSSMDTITPVAQYIEAHLQRINSSILSDGDLLNLLGGEGGVQVDAVFYRVAASKDQISRQLKEANIRLFTFSMPSPNSPTSSDTDRQGIYAISSATGIDHDTMDASLLMSPDYLATLVSQVFSSTGVSWLRHSVARKYIQWRKSDSNTPSSTRPPSLSRNQTLLPLHLPLSSSSPPSSFSFPPPHPRTTTTLPSPLRAVLTPPVGLTSSYALARLADHTQREERLAQVRLANWAADLQRSLAREREEYAALARAERAVWLAERISECVREGGLPVVAGNAEPGMGNGMGRNGRDGEGLVASPTRVGGQGQRRRRRRERCEGQGQGQGQGQHQHQHQRRRQDPLGLLEVAADLRHKGLIALEVLGSLGVLGGLALWVTRHYLHLQAYGWAVGLRLYW
ncbi:hypothetical protein QBC46DRAFT_364863 [Diplogelasinospora grovesii]|uniref:Septin-type G domain-containing protein n=1 Tax=Diplogelasinospora grovesii TaxID=303347 RepID=A0AAN6S3P9_9PEZI|nr:hypothetical protein QBC46DRAFT_364863 [Diplogelasinospora grovesii]